MACTATCANPSLSDKELNCMFRSLRVPTDPVDPVLVTGKTIMSNKKVHIKCHTRKIFLSSKKRQGLSSHDFLAMIRPYQYATHPSELTNDDDKVNSYAYSCLFTNVILYRFLILILEPDKPYLPLSIRQILALETDWNQLNRSS